MIRLLRSSRITRLSSASHPISTVHTLRTLHNTSACSTPSELAEKTETKPNCDENVTGVTDKCAESEEEREITDHTAPTEDITTPWYLRDDIKSSLIEEKEVNLPDVPAHASPLVGTFLNLLASEYGMENLLLFDMTVLDDLHEFKANNNNTDFIIIATGKSERHILKASTELRTHIKHTYNMLPSTEGIVSSSKTPAMRRRTLRRARKGPSFTDNDYGRSANSWVLFHHENIDIHILTSERRQDLNLEALWCAPEDAYLYEQKLMAPVESDHIFSGIRNLHTFACREKISADHAQQHLQTLLSLPIDVEETVLTDLKDQFDANFNATTLNDFDTKFRFYKALHLTNPQLVSFEDAECALLEKYIQDVTSDMTTQKINDVTEYAKLLLDSSATHISSRDTADTALDKLSKFISILYQFSTEQFSMTQNPEFIPLLWRMTYWETGSVVSSKDVDDFILGKKVQALTSQTPSIQVASNDARDVRTLIELSRKRETPQGSYTPAFKELILYTYGNSGKWKKFWAEWDTIFFPNTPSSQTVLTHYVRLVVFLSLIAVPSQSLRFFDYYWKTGSSVSGTFMTCLENNGGNFNNEDDKVAFIKAMRLMMDSLDPDNTVFDKIRGQLVEMEKSGSL